ncbi:acyltransferase [Ramlibacter sp.]|uniref:acyltransferase family protein n=1 Tax=Ramlibacter sp. TaxID=1917967 RepID=UPI002BEE8535|nr:acyltransferase [Ramlibacter sp.]HWI84073.1 acyltransferase [Ramlibacter sp.]
MKDSPNLDLLRSLAVACVVISHLGAHLQWGGPFLNGALGRVGVAIFFVHTTLVLMLSLERHGAAFVPFMVRRVFRIYPLSMTIVVAMVLLDARWGVAANWPAIASNLLLVQNITGHTSNPPTLWSLPLEVQMYLVLPALFAIAGSAAALGRLVTLWMAAVAAVLGLWWLGGDARFIAYVPCFLPGALAYAIGKRATRRLTPFVLFAAAGGFAISVPLAVDLGLPREPMLWAGCLALGTLIPLTRETTYAPIAAAAKQVVTYSYGIYLTHLLSIGVAFFAFPGLPGALQWALFFFCLTSLSCAAYRWIERPGIAMGKRLADASRGASLMRRGGA